VHAPTAARAASNFSVVSDAASAQRGFDFPAWFGWDDEGHLLATFTPGEHITVQPSPPDLVAAPLSEGDRCSRVAVMRFLTQCTIAVSVAGAIHAIRRDRPARMFGLRFPGSTALHAATIGTSISAPPAMLVLLWIADRTGRPRVIRVLAGLFFVGILCEVDTWTTMRHPGDDPAATGVVVAEIALPIALLTAARGRPPVASSRA
jgi:hypothetical protein